MKAVVLAKCKHLTYAGIVCSQCRKCHRCDGCGEESSEESDDMVTSFMHANGLVGPSSWSAGAATAPAPAGAGAKTK